MHPFRLIVRVCPILPVLLAFHCAGTFESDTEPTVQSDYYDPKSPDNNRSYFAVVASHFASCGTTFPQEELHRFTATRYIASNPPDAQVFLGTQYIGRTNHGILYFKPGQYTVYFRKFGVEWSEILSFIEGRNASLTVRKPG